MRYLESWLIVVSAVGVLVVGEKEEEQEGEEEEGGWGMIRNAAAVVGRKVGGQIKAGQTGRQEASGGRDDRQAERQISREADRQADREAGRQAGRQTDR